MGAAKTVIKTVIVIMGILLILASFGALVVANEIDSRVSEECEDAVGSIGEIIGADEEPIVRHLVTDALQRREPEVLG